MENHGSKESTTNSYLLALAIVLGLLIGATIGYMINEKYSAKQESSAVSFEKKQRAFIELNILCLRDHGHPLFQGEEVCIHVPNLKELLQRGE